MRTIPIHTSDRITFKKCRRKWDFSSPIRQGYKRKEGAKPLEFGTAIHAALEVYYNPETWNWLKDDRREVVHGLVLMAFVQTNKLHRLARGENISEEDKEDFAERQALGIGMLQNYFLWAPDNDAWFTPVCVEQKFEVPIDGVWGHLDDQPMYRGKLDVLAVDKDDWYWIIDHKTAARLEEQGPFLELDEQCGSYAWAVQKQLGIRVAGVIYNELYKGHPLPPNLNKNQREGRWYSVNRQQDTSYEMALHTLTEANEPLHLYEDYLTFLRNDGKQYVRRTITQRSQEELENLGMQIAGEVVDMLEDPKIYPNPDKFSCRWCDYQLPCLATNDGSDVKWILKENYVVDVER